MHKLKSIIHDTCNGANAAAKQMIAAKNEDGIAYFGEDEWAAMPPEKKETFYVKCGNHARCLHAVAFARLEQKQNQIDLGNWIKKTKQKHPFARLELDGASVIHALAKLVNRRSVQRMTNFTHLHVLFQIVVIFFSGIPRAMR